ncbi:MAG: tripartite tricarboxylate transporter substrate binding protein [Pigmentiphaga sp.]|nr:tripartite tricarboxylate transporter substrate binding protein [Pigmentiphaga sp.]
MNISKILSQTLWVGALSATLAAPATAAPYPTQPVKIVVGFAAGGLNDVLARLIAAELAPRLGQPVVVENRPGAASNIGTAYVARATPDGHTLLLSSSALAINPNLYENLSYDPLEDLAPISQISTTKMLLMVNPQLGVETMGDLVAAAKAEPGKLNYASAGVGSPIHLASEVFKQATGADIVHVPYRGSSEALVAAMSGQVEVLIDVMPTAVPLIQEGKLKPLAVAAPERAAVLPDVPTSAEAGFPGFLAGSWNGVLAPAGTAPEIIALLNQHIRDIMQSPDIRRRVLELGADAKTSTPEEFAQFMRDETRKWGDIIQSANIRME